MKPRSTLAKRMSSLSAAVFVCVGFLAVPTQAQFQWAERIATTATVPGTEIMCGMTLDSDDNIYVTGWFDGINNFGGVTLTNQSTDGSDIFVAKYNSGGALQWAERAGDSPNNFDQGFGVGVDTNGNVYVTGGFYGPADFGSTNLPGSPDGSQSFFLAKYDNAGTVQWVQQSSGGYGSVYGTGIAVDGAGNSYAIGYDNDGATITFGSTNLSFPGSTGVGYTIFLVKYDNSGAVQWAQSMGGSHETWATKVAVDAFENVYVAGSFGSSKTGGSTLRIGASNLVVSAGSLKNMFVAKFDSAGNLTWVQQPKGGNVDGGAVAVDEAGNVYVTSWFTGTSLNFGGGVSLAGAPTLNAFIAKFNSSGAIKWARAAAGNTKVGLYADVALDGQGNPYVAGCLSSDAVISKYSADGTLQWSYSASGPAGNPVSSVASKCAVDSAGNCYLAGLYAGKTTLGKSVLQPKEAWNFFLAEVTPPAPPKDYVTTSSSPAAGGTTAGAGLYTNGQTVTVTANPNACFDFVSWTKQAKVQSTNLSYTFTITNSEALVANFALVKDEIATASNPAKGGTTTGKGAYGCDKPVTVRATAAAGYKFIGWTVDGTTVSTANPYTFPAAGDETLTANFSDVSMPTLTITSPTPGEKVDTTLLTISGTAKNVLGVGSVVLTFNDNPISATTTNNWTNWAASVILSPGANVISATALSEVGNPSKTRSVTFENTSTGEAPVALAGLIGEVQVGTNAPFQVSFGTATFEQFSADTNQGSSAGNYTYTQTGPDTANFATSTLAPPDQTGTGGAQFTFTSPASATFTNGDGTTGTLTLSPGLGLDVSSQSGWTVTSVDVASHTTTTTFGDGTSTNTDNNGNKTSGAYTSTQYGPMADMVVETNFNSSTGGVETNYVQLMFDSRSNGQWFATIYVGAGGPPSHDSGAFTAAYHSSGLQYLAPASLAGLRGAATGVVDGTTLSHEFSFGASAYGDFSAGTSHANKSVSDVGTYTYTRIGAKTAIIQTIDFAPPEEAGTNSPVLLDFTSSHTANITTSKSHETITFSAAASTAPLSLVGKTFTGPAPGNQATGGISFGNGTFNGTGDLSGVGGTYAYTPYGPQVAMAILNFTLGNGSGTAAGSTWYVEMWFSSATTGSDDNNDFAPDGTLNRLTTGTFTMK